MALGSLYDHRFSYHGSSLSDLQKDRAEDQGRADTRNSSPVRRNYEFRKKLKFNKIALPESYFTNQYIREKNPNAQIISYPNIKSCLDAVNSGKADATILNNYELNYFYSFPRYRELKFNTIPYLTESFSMGISKNAHPLLFSIINKTLHSISEEEFSDAIRNNTQITSKDGFLGLIYTSPLDFFLILSVFFLLFVISVILLLFNIINKKKNKQIAESFKIKFDFLSRMSHDLRTPINTILGYSELAKDNINNPKQMKD